LIAALLRSTSAESLLEFTATPQLEFVTIALFSMRTAADAVGSSARMQ
jgi:hypothetical protein